LRGEKEGNFNESLVNGVEIRMEFRTENKNITNYFSGNWSTLEKNHCRQS
jgi:hypothetical protein